MRPLQWLLRTKGFSPRGNPFRMIKVTRRCLCALVMWKKPWPSSLMAYQPSGDVGCISCSKEFPSRSQGPPCARRSDNTSVVNTSVVSYINNQGFAVTSTLQTAVPNPLVEFVVSSSRLHHGGPQYRSRHPVETGAEARGMEAPPEVVELKWREFDQAQVDLIASRETSHSPLWFSLMHPAPPGLDAMVQM